MAEGLQAKRPPRRAGEIRRGAFQQRAKLRLQVVDGRGRPGHAVKLDPVARAEHGPLAQFAGCAEACAERDGLFRRERQFLAQRERCGVVACAQMKKNAAGRAHGWLEIARAVGAEWLPWSTVSSETSAATNRTVQTQAKRCAMSAPRSRSPSAIA